MGSNIDYPPLSLESVRKWSEKWKEHHPHARAWFAAPMGIFHNSLTPPSPNLDESTLTFDNPASSYVEHCGTYVHHGETCHRCGKMASEAGDEHIALTNIARNER